MLELFKLGQLRHPHVSRSHIHVCNVLVLHRTNPIVPMRLRLPFQQIYVLRCLKGGIEHGDTGNLLGLEGG